MKGFSLTKSTARKKIDVSTNAIAKSSGNGDDDGDGTDKVKIDVILSIQGTKIQSVEEEKKPLVIPLIQPIYNNTSTRTTTNTITTTITANYGEAISEVKVKDEHKTIEQLAEEELLAGLNGGTVKVEAESALTIKSDGSSTKKGAPLLLASLDPSLLEIKDDEARFKKDIELRADDMDFKSDRYKAIPVEEFGAALLRGMGWEGYNKEDEASSKKYDDPIKPRAPRLGLGAAPKPPEAKKGDKRANKELEDEWNKKARDKLSKQKLNEGDLIWIRDPQYAGRKARVLAVQGVPGLDKIRVRLENDGRVLDIRKTDAVLEEDNNTSSTSNGTEQSNNYTTSNDNDKKGKRDYDDRRDRRSRSRSRDRKRSRSRERSRERTRSRSRSRDRKKDKYY